MLGMASKVVEHIDHAPWGDVDARRLGVAPVLWRMARRDARAPARACRMNAALACCEP